MKLKFKLLLLLGLIPAAALRAEFRDETWGGRPFALGGAYIGVPGDAYAPFWNPAGTAGIGHPEAAGVFAKPVVRADESDKALGAFSYVHASSNSTGSFGFWWTNASLTGVSRENALAFNMSRSLYSSETLGSISGGVNVKYLQDSLLTPGSSDRSDLSADAGLLYSLNDRFSLGLSARDINRPEVMQQQDKRLPVLYGAGASAWVTENTLAVLDVVNQTDDFRPKARGGLEQWLMDRHLALRAGGNSDQFTLGLGLRSPVWLGTRFFVDYGYGQPLHLNEHDRIHVVSLRFSFGAAEPAVSTETAQAPEPEVGEERMRVKKEPPPLPEKLVELQERADLLIGADDVIEINVKDHPELNLTTTVDGWGTVKLPYIGTLEVKGMSPDKMQNTLAKIYADFYVQPPVVQVTVREYNSRVIYVLGAVRSPGKYSLKAKPVTLREAVIMAGLPTERAATWRTFVIRQSEDGPIYRHINLYNILYRGRTQKNIELQTGDIIYVPMTLMDSLTTFIGRIVGPLFGLARSGSGALLF